MAAAASELDIVFLESHDGGSHRDFRLGLMSHSRHRYRALTLPPRFWKWRMRGAALWFADRLRRQPPPCDLLLATSLLNVADLRGLLPPPLDRRPLVLYMHENQLTYPLSPQEEFDFHFGFTNIISCLAADLVVFNSTYHRERFLDALPLYLNRMPEAVPAGIRPRLEAKTRVRPVGLRRSPVAASARAVWRGGPCEPQAGPPWPRDGRRPVLLWNHRWEFDKRPDLFAGTVERLLAAGLDFTVVLAGDSRHQEAVFAPLAERLGERCLYFGYAADRERYAALLAQADIVVSCAEQEYFGIAVAEAVHAGCYPVLPRREVYPSLYGPLCRGRHFYDTPADLDRLLADLIRGEGCGHMCSLAVDMDAFCWDQLVASYDELLLDAAAMGGKAPAEREPA